MLCPRCSGPTAVIKTEPTRDGGKARLRRCELDGRFWTVSREKLDHWLPATAIAGRGNGSATANAVSLPLEGGGGVLSLVSVPSPDPDLNPASSKPLRSAHVGRFEEFWGLYPRKVARAAALKMWISRKLDQQADVIIPAIQLQRADFVAREPDKVPHAATWLNGERWKDEIDRRPRAAGRPTGITAWSTE